MFTLIPVQLNFSLLLWCHKYRRKLLWRHISTSVTCWTLHFSEQNFKWNSFYKLPTIICKFYNFFIMQNDLSRCLLLLNSLISRLIWILLFMYKFYWFFHNISPICGIYLHLWWIFVYICQICKLICNYYLHGDQLLGNQMLATNYDDVTRLCWPYNMHYYVIITLKSGKIWNDNLTFK